MALRKAVARLAAGEYFDVIFSDVMMPHMTGMQLYEHLLAENPEAARRIVFLTGGAINARVADFLGAIRNVYFEKPFRGRRLALVRPGRTRRPIAGSPLLLATIAS